MSETIDNNANALVKIIASIVGKAMGKGAADKVTKFLISTGLAKYVVGKSKAVVSAIKSGELTEFLNYATSLKIEAKVEGTKIPSWKDCFKSYKSELVDGSKISWDAMTKKQKVGHVAKTVGAAVSLVGAICVAIGTAETALNATQETDKSTWQWLWDTSIPGATWNWITSLGKGKSNSDSAISGNRAEKNVAQYSKYDPEQLEFLSKYKDAELAAQSGYDVRAIKAMPAADKAKLRNGVENMKNKINGSNDPKWYWKGHADKLIAGTLTWSDVKSNHKTLPLVALTTVNLDLVLPLVDSKLPIKIVNNYEALFAALRGPNTGAYNYAAEDVFYYTTYLYSFITRIRYLQKIIKAAHTHKVEQDNLARILTNQITGYTSFYDEIVKDGPSLISQLNALSEDINTWPLIGTSWLSRWNYLADKCIKDYNGPKAVLGVYCIRSIFGYDTGASKPAQITVLSNTMANTIAALQTEYNAFKSLQGTLSVNNCMLKIAGDMCKLLGTSSNVFGNVPYLEQTRPGVLTFEYDEEAKFQLQNAKLAGRTAIVSNWVLPSFDGSTSGVYTYSNTIGSASVTVTGTDPYNKANPWIVVNDSTSAVRSDANNIEMTQFVYNADVVQNDGSGSYVQTMIDVSIAIFAFFGVHYYTPGSSGGAVTTGYISTFCNPGGASSYQDYLPWMLFVAIRQIDFLPSPVISTGTGSGSRTLQGRYIDVDNYAEITADQIKNYIKVATYSLSYTYSMEDVDLKSKVKR